MGYRRPRSTSKPLLLLSLGLAAALTFLAWMFDRSTAIPDGSPAGPPTGSVPDDAGRPGVDEPGSLEPLAGSERVGAGAVQVESSGPTAGSSEMAPGGDVAAELEIQVVARDGGVGIAGALVLQHVPGTPLVQTRSDGEGRLRVADLGGALRVVHGDYVDATLPRIPLERPVRIELVRSLRLRGRLVDVSSTPLPGIPVRLGAGPIEAGLDWNDERPLELLTESDEQGRFEFENLAPSTYTLLIAEADEAYAAVVDERVELWPGENGERTYVLSSGATLKAQVLWHRSSTPVEDVMVDIAPSTPWLDGGERQAATGRTDADGRFEFGALSRVLYTVRVRAAWGATLENEVRAPGPNETFECRFELRRPAAASGRVYDGNGEPVGGAVVRITARPEGRDFDWQSPTTGEMASPFLLNTTTAPDGEYRFEAVPTRQALWIVALSPGELERDPRPAHFEPLRMIEGESRAGIDLTLAGRGEIEGLVTDESGAPLQGVEIEAWHVRWGFNVPGMQARSDADGRFRVGPLPFGPTRVEYSREGYRDAVQGTQLVEGSRAILEKELVEAFRLHGWVVDGAGFAVGDAQVSARSEPVPRRSRARTDALGAFELEGLTERHWRVRAQAPGRSSMDPDGVEVDVPSSAPLVLTLVAEEREATGTVLGEIRWAGSGRPVWDLTLGGKRGGATRLADSHFEVHGMRPGRTTLRATAVGMEPLGIGPVDVLPGGTVDVGVYEAVRATRLLVAVRRHPGGALLSGVEARLEALPKKENGWGAGRPAFELHETDRAGIFAHAGVPRRRWRLKISRPGFAPHSEIVRISGSKQTLSVFLKASGGAK